MGGMRTVIWTDVMQFGLFTFGGLTALFWVVCHLDGGWAEYVTTANQFGRMNVWDGRWGFDASMKFTFWVAVLAVPFQNLTAFGVDQLNAQRMFCCKDKSAARKALIWSSGGQLLTLLMLMVGAALFVHYDKHPFNASEGAEVMGIEKTIEKEERFALAEAAMTKAQRIGNPAVPVENLNIGEAGVYADQVSNVVKPSKPDNVFPMWIVTQLPRGLSGLILAGIFAAAISSLDSILAALSQTTLSFFYHPEGKTDEELEEMNLLVKSRWLVVMWGVLLTAFTLLLVVVAQGIPVLPLAFGMTAYTMGPLLALFLCSMIGKGSFRGLAIGAIISFLITMFGRMDVWVLVDKSGFDISWLTDLPSYRLNGAGKIEASICFAWFWPLTTFVTMAFGLLIPKRKR